MMQQQRPGPNPQGIQNVIKSDQQLMSITMQMSEQGQVMDQDHLNVKDDFYFNDLI